MTKQYKQLSYQDKVRLDVLLQSGYSIRAAALQLGRSPSTLSREVRRTSCGDVPYSAEASVRRQAHLRQQCGRARRKLGDDLSSKRWQSLLHCMTFGLSPEQFAGRIRQQSIAPLEYLCDPVYVSHETVYRAIYSFAHRPTRNWLVRHLRQSRQGRRRWKRAKRRNTGLRDIVPISQRPEEVNLRDVAGHWEGDIIKGAKGTTAVVLTLLERTSRYCLLIKLPNAWASTVRDAIIGALGRLPQNLRLSMAYDRGSEMALHQEVTSTLHLPVYICDPYCPWQRGLNENTNGLVRQYLPKGLDLTQISQEHVSIIQYALNHRPRKILGYRTPAEVLAAHCR